MLVSSDINSANHNYPTNYDEAVDDPPVLPRHGAQQHLLRAGRLAGAARYRQPSGGIRGWLRATADQSGGHRRHPERTAVHHELLRNSQPDPVRGQGGHRPDGARRAPRTPARRPGWPDSWSPTRAAPSPAPMFPAGLRGNETAPAHDHDRGGRAAGQHRRDRPARQGQPGLGPALRLRQSQHGRGDGPDPPEAWPADPRGLALRNAAHAASRRRRRSTGRDWFSPIDVARVPASGLQIRGRAAAPHEGEVGAGGSSTRAVRTRRTRASRTSRGRADRPGERRPGNAFEVAADEPGRPDAAARSSTTPDGPRRGRRRRLARRSYPNPDPERHAFQIRLTVHRRPTRPTSAATARRCSPTATTGTSQAGRSRSAPAPPPPRTSPDRAVRPLRASGMSTATTSSTSCWLPRVASSTRSTTTAPRWRASTAGSPCGPIRSRWPRAIRSTRRCPGRVNRFAFRRSATSTTIWTRRSSPPRESTSTPGTWTARASRASPCASTRRSPIRATRAPPIHASTPPIVT